MKINERLVLIILDVKKEEKCDSENLAIIK